MSHQLVIGQSTSGLNPALVGLVLTYVISLADLLQYGIRVSTEVENNVSCPLNNLLMEYQVVCIHADGVCRTSHGLLQTEIGSFNGDSPTKYQPFSKLARERKNNNGEYVISVLSPASIGAQQSLFHY